ncbi:SET and MYND domain-containing protein 4-like isoform X3 [Homarus americanus]|uniref:SET and MYND domain-containing protein 4-like isoform X3 n=1 Tax=Homarus americanus TaxID=6706 RepID=UPI001C45ADBF|nr:SET and MYND domain-containing protein 4-like isoform X3 [Homarus americanus]
MAQPFADPLPQLNRSRKMLEDADRPGFFKDYYKAVRKATSNDQFNEFSKLKTDEERFRFCFNLPAAHDIDIRTYFKGKSEKEAMEKKEAGNKCFGRKNNVEALKLYSQAVVKAPVPSGKYWKLIKECADPRKMTLYAICLANRSAALYHLREYHYCVKDIDEALEHHYPKELKYKLYKRKARLLSHMKQHVDARDAYRQALKWLDWAKMEREKRIEHQTEIQKWLKMYETGKVVKNWDVPEGYIEPAPLIPNLTGGSNERFPSLSKKVDVKYDNNQGRYAVAAEDIEVGDVIATEKPFASVLLREEYGNHCQKCFKVTKAPIPCKKCSSVLFCSVECRQESSFHSIECPILDLLTGSGMSINCFLAFRLVTQYPLSFFLDFKDQLTEEDPKDTTNNKQVYDPSDFLRLYHLVCHSQSRTPEDFFHRCIMIVFMVKALKKTKYFETKGSASTYPLFKDKGDKITDTEAFVGSLLLRFLQIVQFNAHEVSEFVLAAPKCFDGSKNESLGAAIYPTLALFNHSCHSAQVRLFSGNQVITKTIRQIRKGDLIPENYGQSFTSKIKSERKAELADRYWFECNCEACQKDWPMYKDMTNSVLTFKCHKCQGPLPVNTENLLIPFFKCERCGDQTNILSSLKNLQNTEQTFKGACKEMELFNLEKADNLLVENLKQLESCLYAPYRDYHLTQEAYMRVCLCQGNNKVKSLKTEE